MKTITIHQPCYLPWLGLFHKIMLSDVFVILDDVQFEKNSFINRNKVKTPNGSCWLTIPVLSHDKPFINKLKIDNKQDWQKKHINTIKYNYVSSKFYNKYIEFFEGTYDFRWIKLIDLNILFIRWLLNELNIKTKIILSSSIKNKGTKSDLVLNICKKLNTNIYVSGSLGKDYLELKKFKKANIKVYFQIYNHPVYNQLWKGFEPNLSVIDLLFNYGEKSKEIIMRGNIEREELENGK